MKKPLVSLVLALAALASFPSCSSCNPPGQLTIQEYKALIYESTLDLLEKERIARPGGGATTFKVAALPVDYTGEYDPGANSAALNSRINAAIADAKMFTAIDGGIVAAAMAQERIGSAPAAFLSPGNEKLNAALRANGQAADYFIRGELVTLSYEENGCLKQREVQLQLFMTNTENFDMAQTGEYSVLKPEQL